MFQLNGPKSNLHHRTSNTFKCIYDPRLVWAFKIQGTKMVRKSRTGNYNPYKLGNCSF